MARKAKEGVTGDCKNPECPRLAGVGPSPVLPRAPVPSTEISCLALPPGTLSDVASHNPGGRFRFSCDVCISSVDWTTHHPSSPEPSSESFKFVGCGDPTLAVIPSEHVEPSELLAGLKLAYDWTDCPAEDDGISPHASESSVADFNEGKTVQKQLKALIARAEANGQASEAEDPLKDPHAPNT